STSIYAVKGVFHTYEKIEDDLIKKIENVSLPTVKNENTGEEYYPEKAKNQIIAYPVFRGTLDPDITFFGFNIPPQNIRGESDSQERDNDEKAGWFFIFQEQPSEPMFGYDLYEGNEDVLTNPPTTWNDLTWNHLKLNASRYVDISGSKTLINGESGIIIEDNQWGSHSADMANISLQMPIRIAIHGSEMVGE
ncbi:MAG: hypothetical protein ACXAC7_22260, partial [Candidatus Hodarchaeales archaeon]